MRGTQVCVIIDANVVVAAVLPPVDSDFHPIQAALVAGRARIVVGGKLRREYLRVRKLQPVLQELVRGGRARLIPDATVDIAEAILAGACRSDDPHIVALAQVSGARLLCSDDGDLCTDFKNPALLSNPRGAVYRNPTHQPLIRRCCRNTR